ncbi:ArsR/SmtB family transcription factor [Demequina zhanjiangensis]|uniref:Metalloregulator ArsR/SmtB family transcription factor n=1 Tax=Demequina zhanjiangensis TaxID=3051659 RepID=A0ABT8G491_9MICO|nr:metalloregulator ArsR/SmtB family transcription factor [Demequina sp. SYSU T00b26]MDN4473956.1 metalloregulator ArsR/SmtB family transcription factor [Demequina sp. SYSU T00b26]
MVVQTELSDAEVDRLFHALADATRRDIVRRTLAGDESVTDLAAEYSMSFAAVSKHVAVLEEAGLVTRRPDGRKRLVRADPKRLAQAQRLLDAFEQVWRHRIDALDVVLTADPRTS